MNEDETRMIRREFTDLHRRIDDLKSSLTLITQLITVFVGAWFGNFFFG